MARSLWQASWSLEEHICLLFMRRTARGEAGTPSGSPESGYRKAAQAAEAAEAAEAVLPTPAAPVFSPTTTLTLTPRQRSTISVSNRLLSCFLSNPIPLNGNHPSGSVDSNCHSDPSYEKSDTNACLKNRSNERVHLKKRSTAISMHDRFLKRTLSLV